MSGSVLQTDSFIPVGATSVSLVTNPANTYLYVVNGGDDTISQLSIDGGNALANSSPATVTAPVQPRASAVSPDGKFLFVTGSTNGDVWSYSIGANGKLTKN